MSNSTVIQNELSMGYELADLRIIARGLGLSKDQITSEKARTSKAFVASAISSICDPFTVRDYMERTGYDVSDIVLDDYEKRAPVEPELPEGKELEGWEKFESEHPAEAAKIEEKAGKKSEFFDSLKRQAERKGELSEKQLEAAMKDRKPKLQKDEETGETKLVPDEPDAIEEPFVPDDSSKYFGTGQSAYLQEMLSHLEQQPAGQAQPKFEVKQVDHTKLDIDGIAPKQLQFVLDLAAARLPIMLVGPTGCGKTHLADVVAKCLNMEFNSVSCTEGMSESNLTGWLLPVEDGGKFVYVSAAFVEMYENGGVFLLDEVDASDSNVLLILNSAVANGYLNIPQRHLAPVAKKHPDFVLIAAANTYGNGADMHFVGRNQLDRATLDRFKAGTVTMDYDADVEASIVTECILDWGRTMRAKLTRSNIEQALSTRFMRDLSVLHSVNSETYGQAFWEQQLFTGWSQDEVSRVS